MNCLQWYTAPQIELTNLKLMMNGQTAARHRDAESGTLLPGYMLISQLTLKP